MFWDVAIYFHTTTTTTTTTTISPKGHPVSSRQGDPLGQGFFPHFVGGIRRLKSFLFTPYPAIPPYVVQTPHPGMTDDREHITSKRKLQEGGPRSEGGLGSLGRSVRGLGCLAGVRRGLGGGVADFLRRIHPKNIYSTSTRCRQYEAPTTY